MKSLSFLTFFFFSSIILAQGECIIAYQSDYFLVNKTNQDITVLRNNRDLVNFPTEGPDTFLLERGKKMMVGEVGWAERFVNPVQQFVFRTEPGGLTRTCVPDNWVFQKESETKASYTLELKKELVEPCPEEASALYWVSKQEREGMLVIEFPDTLAEFPGGMNSLMKYMRDNVRYPDSLMHEGIVGTVYVDFVVNIDGSLVDIQVLRSPHQALSDEALRLITNMPNWIPGKLKGNVVRSKMRLPIRFRLD